MRSVWGLERYIWRHWRDPSGRPAAADPLHLIKGDAEEARYVQLKTGNRATVLSLARVFERHRPCCPDKRRRRAGDR
jgi:hypothetical protein